MHETSSKWESPEIEGVSSRCYTTEKVRVSLKKGLSPQKNQASGIKNESKTGLGEKCSGDELAPSPPPSPQKTNVSCGLIRDHNRTCRCSTPRLHVYLLNKHQCTSSCKASQPNDETPQASSDSLDDLQNQKVLGLDNLETANIIMEERIIPIEGSPRMRLLASPVTPKKDNKTPSGEKRRKRRRKVLCKAKEHFLRERKNRGNGVFYRKRILLKSLRKEATPPIEETNGEDTVDSDDSRQSKAALTSLKGKDQNLGSQREVILTRVEEDENAKPSSNDDSSEAKLAIRKQTTLSTQSRAGASSITEAKENVSRSESIFFSDLKENHSSISTNKDSRSNRSKSFHSLSNFNKQIPSSKQKKKGEKSSLEDSKKKDVTQISASSDILSSNSSRKEDNSPTLSHPEKATQGTMGDADLRMRPIAPNTQEQSSKKMTVTGVTPATKRSSDKNGKKSTPHLREISRNLPLAEAFNERDIREQSGNRNIFEHVYKKRKAQKNGADIYSIKTRKSSKRIEENSSRVVNKNSLPTCLENKKKTRENLNPKPIIKATKKGLSAPEVKLDSALPPKKNKRLFEINKNGVFHSFSQNLIKISAVSSLTSSEQIETSKGKQKMLKDVKEFDSEHFLELKDSNLNFIPPFQIDVVVKSSPSDDEDNLDHTPTNYDSSSIALPTNGQSFLEDGLELKSESSPLVNIKSETIIEECLNVDEEENLPSLDSGFPKLAENLNEEKKSSSLWVAPPEKYSHFDDRETRCTLCKTPFPDFISLVAHLEKHQRNGFILCYYCQKSFGDKTSMRRHMRTHTGEKPYQCKICEKRFSLPGNFKKHRDIHEDIRTEPCDICGKTFRRKEHLKYHKRTHTGEKPFKCTLCGSCFTARYSLQIHMNVHLGKKPYKCSDCGKAFCDKSTMRKHIRVHTGERPFTCEMCHKTFGESGSLSAHVATHSEERPFLCTQCKLSFKTSGGLRQHMKTHMGVKRFACKYCGMMFIQKYNMLMHERIHTGEKPYECSECQRTFRSRSCLGKHVILHGGEAERKYSCHHCDKKFFRKAHLKRHINTHLGIKEYECSFCFKRFSTNVSLKKHLTTFHTEGARAFPCFVCGRIFKRSVYVATHKCIEALVKIEPDQ